MSSQNTKLIMLIAAFQLKINLRYQVFAKIENQPQDVICDERCELYERLLL